MKIKKKVIVLIMIGIMGVYGYSQKDSLFVGNAENEERISQKVMNIQGEKVKERKMEEIIHLTGSLEENEKAFVSSKISGKVHVIKGKEGDLVKKGQLLLGLESQDYQNKMELAKATLEKAKANFDSSKINYERVKALYDEGVASKSEYDKVNTLYLVAKADLSSAEASISIAKEAIDNTSIFSPMNGFITKKDVSIGQVLSPGMQLMEIRDLSSIYMIIDIKQSNLSKIKLNQEVKITLDTYKDKAFKGYIKEIAPLANESSRTFKTKILIKNKDFLLKPGMFASCNIQTGIQKNILYIPVTSLLGKEGAYYTYVIDENVVKRVPVKIGEIINDTVAIESGLEKDEVVAVTNLNQLKDKDPVKLVAKK
ncbi:efflux RND transporter periplasmic adaptor subunit [Crassaminicella profunda]|uniref:efflux RND transporter periplasmic adaptor subunit n=1 Tax=Crassaminicella profunda TaxID=1286698 RepID=UPI001CA6E275|nr:efflux RND transporter periplasmic adaptor subunit [Crassaminicella profunda]QZY56124.1 efflux RND transporter periplasmic adaptor subunit [Crassaminicella profunda]